MNETSKQLRTIIAQRQEQSDRKGTQELCKNSSTKVSSLRRTYQDFSEFCVVYNPDEQLRYRDAEEVLKNIDKSATLRDISNAYQENAGASWLIPQISNLSEFCGVRQKITDQQIKELSRLIEAEYGYLTVPEFMLFFHRFKAGKYGEFYGNVDPMVITESLCEFIKWRNKLLADIELNKQTCKTWDSYDHWKSEEEKRKAWAKQLCNPKSKSIGFTSRSDKTKVNPIGEVMGGMNK